MVVVELEPSSFVVSPLRVTGKDVFAEWVEECDGDRPVSGAGVLLTCGTEKEDCPLREGELVTAAEDCDRCLIESSDGLRRRSWLLEERWPGVRLRGT